MPPRKKSRTSIPDPSPPPSPIVEESSSEEEEEDDTIGTALKPLAIKPGMYLDANEVFVPELFKLLDDFNLTNFCTFQRNWYPSIVRDFYTNGRFNSIEVQYDVGNFVMRLDENVFANYFGMNITGLVDYPVRGWSTNWPVSREDCFEFLNNGRPLPKVGFAYKQNLTGFQKLVFKVVNSILLPTKNQASEISNTHAFVTWALLHRTPINMPRMIIRHMGYQQKKSHGPYGIILSSMLTDQLRVPIANANKENVKKASKVGAQSLVQQELFLWRDSIYAQWEIDRDFSHEVDDVYRANPPAARPRGAGSSVRSSAQRREAPYPPPPTHQMYLEGPSSSSTSSMNDRQLLDHIYEEMKAMRLSMDSLNNRVGDIQQYIDEEKDAVLLWMKTRTRAIEDFYVFLLWTFMFFMFCNELDTFLCVSCFVMNFIFMRFMNE